MTREQIEALPADSFAALHSAVQSVYVTRLHASRARMTLARRLAALAIGESLLLDWAPLRHLAPRDRDRARALLGNPNATWAGLTTRDGLRLTRIA